MTKRSLNVILISVTLVTIVLIVLGVIYRQSSFEKLNGFTSNYAISIDGNIAYVNYNDGQSEIYIYGQDNPVVTIEVDKEIYHMTYSLDGQKLLYVVNEKEINPEKLQSTVYELDLKTIKQNELFQDDKVITEITFDPKDDNLLFYLGATTYEHYSPIVRSAPHNFDIYSYAIDTEQIDRHTQLNKYGMTSLQISNKDNTAYVHMDNDLKAETAEDVFEAEQKIFSIPLNQPDNLDVFHDVDKIDDVYDTLYIEELDIIIYQAVSGLTDKGIYQYDLYIVDLETDKVKKLTDLGEYTAQPTYSPADEKIYFIVDKQFAEQYPDYYLYRINLDRSELEQLDLN